MFRSVGLFGLGKSKKKVEVSEGIVHDTKQSADAQSKNILDEFEAQFSQGGPVASSDPAPREARIPETMHSARSEDPFADLSSDPFTPPQSTRNQPPQQHPQRTSPSDPFASSSQSTQQGADDPFAPPRPVQQGPAQRSEDPFALPKPAQQAPAPQREDPFAQPLRSGQNPASATSRPDAFEQMRTPQPTNQAPAEDREPFIPLAPANQQRRESVSDQPRRETAPAPSSRMPPSHPSARIPTHSLDMNDRDLPDFDFDFHPSENETPAANAPKRSLDFDIPDFSSQNAFESAKPKLRSERMDTPFDEAPKRPVERPVERTPEPAVEEAPHRDVIMRGGTLFIEKHTLIRHVHDLSDLKGLSSSTHEQFQRIDALAKDEKEVLDKMRVEIQAVYDTLEQADGLLFSGE